MTMSIDRIVDSDTILVFVNVVDNYKECVFFIILMFIILLWWCECFILMILMIRNDGVDHTVNDRKYEYVYVVC
jgi:hypothetical protein